MLEVRNLSCGYDSKFFLQNINFNIQHGEIVGIIGPNGSGKTTLLRAITKILNPGQGLILIEGKNIAQMELKELAKKVAVVPQDFNIDFMTVEEFVLLGRIPYFQRFQFLETKKDLEIAERCLVLTDTHKLKDRFLSETSGGEKQLVLIAKALAQEPKLLLLDEPTSHLDITHQVVILDLVKKLNRDFGLTVCMVLHDLNLASEYCNRLLLLNNGLIHKSGIPKEVLTYQTIEEVYRTVVIVKENPVTHKPYIFLVPGETS
ncbi:MAG: ABC transporter ATP-binding protein [Elusimicrobia bacterium]|nr:ABC transporter ATP-binding protein [Elusimicrobiota bacterium]